jgi:hypothetical protein
MNWNQSAKSGKTTMMRFGMGRLAGAGLHCFRNEEGCCAPGGALWRRATRTSYRGANPCGLQHPHLIKREETLKADQRPRIETLQSILAMKDSIPKYTVVGLRYRKLLFVLYP